MNDSLEAAKLKPDYIKAIVRAAQCCLKLKRYSDGLKWCDYGIRLKETDPSLVKLRTELVQGQVRCKFSKKLGLNVKTNVIS